MPTPRSQLLPEAHAIKMADDPDFLPPVHRKKGSLLYDVEENRRRRSVRYQLEQLKQKNDASESEDVENEDDANAASAVPVSHDQDLELGAVGGEVNHYPHSPPSLSQKGRYGGTVVFCTLFVGTFTNLQTTIIIIIINAIISIIIESV